MTFPPSRHWEIEKVPPDALARAREQQMAREAECLSGLVHDDVTRVKPKVRKVEDVDLPVPDRFGG
jgi:hypothetical protein